MTAENLRPGKLPPQLLRQLLAAVPRDASVIVGAGLGEDAAVLDVGAPELVVAAADPITLAGEAIGPYLLAVNANDLATTGATPRWFLATVLLPEGTTPDAARALLGEIRQACAATGVALVGGHTEVTAGLDRTIVSGCLLGTVAPERAVRTSGAQIGDVILLTGGIALEGSAILAREHAAVLTAAGVSAAALASAAGWMLDPGIAVEPAARAVHATGAAHAMHDPTEGGLATALHELADAAQVGLRVRAADIQVLPACAEICARTGLDPLGLLASGALLACVAPDQAADALARLAAAAIPAATIGRVESPASGRRIVRHGRTDPLPRFERDELARFLSGP